MPPTAQKPYWVDEDLNLHEAYFYGESASDSRPIALEVRGHSLTLIAPHSVPEFEIREARVGGEYLFIIGEQIEDEDDDVDDEGSGIIVVARRCPDRDSTYWTLIAHDLYPSGNSRVHHQPAAEPHSHAPRRRDRWLRSDAPMKSCSWDCSSSSW